jgi:predicted nucleic-acid-binding Zn-ribbon protein
MNCPKCSGTASVKSGKIKVTNAKKEVIIDKKIVPLYSNL